MRQRLTGFARALRRQETNAEQRLWRELRNRQVDGWKFKRQAPHGRYVLDFFCADAALVIEVDGFQHMDARATHDAERTTYLEREGLRVLRLTNTDVLDNRGSGERLSGAWTAARPLTRRCAPTSPQGERRKRRQGIMTTGKAAQAFINISRRFPPSPLAGEGWGGGCARPEMLEHHPLPNPPPSRGRECSCNRGKGSASQ